MKNRLVPDDFIPDGIVSLGDVDDSLERAEDSSDSDITALEPYMSGDIDSGSFLDSVRAQIHEYGFDLEGLIDGRRGTTFIYGKDDKVIAVADEGEDLGLDFYEFYGDEFEFEPVEEQLSGESDSSVEGVYNELHETISGGEEAYDRVYRLLSVSK